MSTHTHYGVHIYTGTDIHPFVYKAPSKAFQIWPIARSPSMYHHKGHSTQTQVPWFQPPQHLPLMAQSTKPVVSLRIKRTAALDGQIKQLAPNSPLRES